MYLIFVLYALFGSVFTAGKIGLEHAEPVFLIGFRMVIAGLILGLYQLIRDPKKLNVPLNLVPKVVLLGLFNIYFTNAFEFWGMQYLSSAKTSFIYSLSPFFAALLSYFVFGESLSRKKLAGLIIGFIGFIPILWKEDVGDLSQVSFGFISLAEAAVIFAAMATVYGWILMRQLIDKGISPIVSNAYSMFLGGVFSLLHSSFTENWSPVPITGELAPLMETIIWMVVVSSLICYNLYGYLLKRFSVTFLSFAGFTTPFFTAIFSWFLIGETLGTSFFLSALVVFIGLFLFYQEELKEEGLEKKPVEQEIS